MGISRKSESSMTEYDKLGYIVAIEPSKTPRQAPRPRSGKSTWANLTETPPLTSSFGIHEARIQYISPLESVFCVALIIG